jgi:hypothetical protein
MRHTGQTNRHVVMQADRHADKQTDIHADYIERDADKQAGRQTKTDRLSFS